MSQESSNHVVFPVKTVSKNSLYLIPSFTNKRPDQTALAEKTGQLERLIPDSREGDSEQVVYQIKANIS